MEITLRSAHKLVGKINAKIDSYDLSVNARINVWNTPTNADALAASLGKVREYHTSRVQNLTKLITIRHQVRLAIQKANAAKVDELVAYRKTLLDTRQMYHKIIAAAGSSVYFTPDAVQRKIELARQTQDNRYSSVDHLAVCVLNEEDVAAAKAELSRVDREIEKVEDDLTAANSTTKISLDESVIATLTAENLL